MSDQHFTHPGQQPPTGAPVQQPVAGGYGPVYGVPGAPQPPRNRSKAPLIIGIAAALVAALVLTAVLLAQAASRREQQEAAALVDSAVASVEALFQAVARGDAQAALGYVVPEGDGTELLTDEVLAASAALAPITEIVVTPPAAIEESTMSSDIDVSYLLGDTPVQQTYQVRDSERDGTWVVDGAIVDGSFHDAFDGLEVTINGVAVTSETFMLLPGAYEVGITSEHFTVAGEATFQVTDLYSVDLFGIDPALSDDGVTAFREAVQAAVETCIGATSLEAGCGLTLPATLSDGTVLEDGTLERTISTDVRTTIENLTPELSSANPALAIGEHLGGVEVSGGCSKDGQTGSCEIIFAPSLGAPSILMTDPELTVEWD